jgi:hypothetical protein
MRRRRFSKLRHNKGCVATFKLASLNSNSDDAALKDWITVNTQTEWM